MEGLFDAERARDSLIQRQRLASNVVVEPTGIRTLQTRYEDADLSRRRLLLLQQAQAGVKLDSTLEKQQRKRLKKRLKTRGGALGKDRRGKSAVVSGRQLGKTEEELKVEKEKIEADERASQRLQQEAQADRFQRGIEAQDLIALRDRERADLRQIEADRQLLEGQQAQLGFIAEGGRQAIERERIGADIGRYNADVRRAELERQRAIGVAERELAQIEARNAAEVEQARILRDREVQERDIARRERERDLDQQLRLRGIESKDERERVRRAERQDQQLHESRIEELMEKRAQDAERAAIDRDREATLESTIRALQRRDLPDPIPETQGFTQAQQRFIGQVFRQAGAEVDRRIGESETRIRDQLRGFGARTGQPIDIEFLPREAVEDEDRDRAGGGSVRLSTASNQSGGDEQIGGGDLGNRGREGGLDDTGTDRFHTPEQSAQHTVPDQRQPEPEPPAEEQPLLREATEEEAEEVQARQVGGFRTGSDIDLLLAEQEEADRPLRSDESVDPFGSEREQELRGDPAFARTESPLSPSTPSELDVIPAERLRRGGGRGTGQQSGSEEGSGFLEGPERAQSPAPRSPRRTSSPLPPLIQGDSPATELQRLLAADPATLSPRSVARRGQAVAQDDPLGLELPEVPPEQTKREEALVVPEQQEGEDTPRGLRAIPAGIVGAGQAAAAAFQEAIRPENPAEALQRVEQAAEQRARAPEVRPGQQYGGQLRAGDGSLVVGAQYGIGEDPEVDGFQAVGGDAHGHGGGAEQPIAQPQGLELPDVPAGVQQTGGGQIEAVEEEQGLEPTSDPRVRTSNALFGSSDFNIHIADLTMEGRGGSNRGQYVFQNNTGSTLKKIPPGASAVLTGAKGDGTYKLEIGGQQILMTDAVADRLVKEGKIIVKRK